MTVNHDAVAAFPTVGNPNKTLARNVLVARMPYVLADTDDSRNLIAVDPSTGAIIVDMLLLGRVFHYDPTDTTTVHDGTSCLVSADGLRYKLALGTDVFAYAVLDNTIATPPGSPSLGDAYLVAAGATGAWAGKSNFIAVKTNRGWEFVNFSIGRFIYVESVDTYYHKNAGGAWVTGFGNNIFAAKSVPLSAAINFGTRLIVENQTTTAPPGSPTVGTAYIIGPSATGGWSGLDGKIAICEVAGSFVVYTPTNGWSAYDKNLNNTFTFNGSAWKSSVGAWLNFGPVQLSAGSSSVANNGSGTLYSFSATAPTTAQRLTIDQIPYNYAASRTGARLRIRYRANFVLSNSGATVGTLIFTAALFRDAVASAIRWILVPVISPSALTWTFGCTFEFNVTAVDAAAHNYSFALMSSTQVGGASQVDATSISEREFTLEEAAA